MKHSYPYDYWYDYNRYWNSIAYEPRHSKATGFIKPNS